MCNLHTNSIHVLDNGMQAAHALHKSIAKLKILLGTVLFTMFMPLSAAVTYKDHNRHWRKITKPDPLFSPANRMPGFWLPVDYLSFFIPALYLLSSMSLHSAGLSALCSNTVLLQRYWISTTTRFTFLASLLVTIADGHSSLAESRGEAQRMC